MLEVLFAQDSEVKICSVVLLLTLNPACSSANIFLASGFKPIQDDFQDDFA